MIMKNNAIIEITTIENIEADLAELTDEYMTNQMYNNTINCTISVFDNIKTIKYEIEEEGSYLINIKKKMVEIEKEGFLSYNYIFEENKNHNAVIKISNNNQINVVIKTNYLNIENNKIEIWYDEYDEYDNKFNSINTTIKIIEK